MNQYEKISICSGFRALISKTCQTGSAWGVLEGQPMLIFVLWWGIRHTIYACGITAILLSKADPVVFQCLGIFIVAIHCFKAWLYLTATDGTVKNDPSVTRFKSVNNNELSVVPTQAPRDSALSRPDDFYKEEV